MMKILKKLLAGLKNWIEVTGERYVRSNWGELHALPFFHSIYYGAGAHYCRGWKAAGNAFHNDANVAIVVTRHGKVSGVVGFDIIGSTMFVRQLMGAPRAHFHDGVTTVEEYLLYCTEEIARALRIKTLRIISPETVIEYWRTAREKDFTPEEVEKILRSMKKMYGHPAKLGYPKTYFWRLRRMTFSRQLS